MEFTHAFYDALPPEAAAIRQAVFVEEQGFQEEFDAIDRHALHRKRVLPEDKEVALIVLNTPYTIKYQGKLGQIDVYPTLLDIMGANHYLWKGIGQSIFRKNENGQTNFDEMWDISSLLITKRYFKDNNINEIPN